MAWGSGKGAGFKSSGRQRSLGSYQKQQEQPLEDLIVDHLDWLAVSEGSELALEMEVVKAQASDFWDLPQSDRLSPQKNIVEVSTLMRMYGA